MKSVFVVMAGVFYEGSMTLKAFADKADADAFAKILSEYDSGRQRSPHINDSQNLWDRFIKKDERWRKKHPGGEDAIGADYYSVYEIPFIEAQP